jgi:DNA repair protein RecO (recombination protein O)
MSRARIQLQPAWLLSRREYRDTSLLIEAYTRDHGRIGLVARGVRGPRSTRSAALQTFRPLLLSWNEGGDLGSLTGVENAGAALELGGEALFCGWYVNELLLNLLTRHDPHPPLFGVYAESLQRLAQEPVQPVLRAFELALLAELGYGLRLPGELRGDVDYVYDWEDGPLPATAGSRGTFPGRSLIALRDDRLAGADPTVLEAARRLLRAAIRRQLGDRELSTPKLLREMRAATGGRSQESGDGEGKR